MSSYISKGTNPATDLKANFEQAELKMNNNVVLTTNSVINDLSDVNAPAPSNGQLLSWDSGTTQWIPSTASASGSQFYLRSCDGRTGVNPPTFNTADGTFAATPLGWQSATLTNPMNETNTNGSLAVFGNIGQSIEYLFGQGSRKVTVRYKVMVDIPTGVNVWVAIDVANPGTSILTQSIVFVPSSLIDRTGHLIETSAIFTTSGGTSTYMSGINYHDSGVALNIYSPQLSAEVMDLTFFKKVLTKKLRK